MNIIHTWVVVANKVLDRLHTISKSVSHNNNLQSANKTLT